MPKQKETDPPTRTPQQVAEMSEAEKVRVLRDLESNVRLEKARIKDAKAASKDLIDDLEQQILEILEPGLIEPEK